MCNQMTEETKYKEYDHIVSTIMTNVLIERERYGSFLLYDFNIDSDADILYYNITAIAADLRKENIYLDMPLKKYWKFKKNRKNRKNLKWFSPFKKRRLKDEFKTSVIILMEFVREQLNFSYELFKEINDEYYGGK